MGDDAVKGPGETPTSPPAPEAGQPAGAQPAEQPAERKKAAKAKAVRHVPSAVAHIEATFNNTKVCITDQHGNVLTWCTGGRLGFKGAKKSTAYVAQQVATEAAKRAMAMGVREVEVRIKGPGARRESAVRGIAASGLDITVLKDATPIPHNGCRPPKRRRV